MKLFTPLLSLSAMTLSALAHFSASAGIIVLENSVAAEAIADAAPTGAASGFSSGIYPSSGFLNVNDPDDAGGGAHNNTTSNADFSADGSGFYALMNVQHRTDNLVDESPYDSVFSTLRVLFNLTGDTHYRVGGFYSLFGSASRFFSSVHLKNDAEEMIFRDHSVSADTDNEHFVLGTAGNGDLVNINTGSASGILSAGSYEFYAVVGMDSADKDFNTLYLDNTSTGCSGLMLGNGSLSNDCEVRFDPVDLPEPGGLLLFSMGGLLLFTQRKKAKA